MPAKSAIKKTGRPRLAHPRRRGLFVRFSDTEWGALASAVKREHPGTVRPTLADWTRDLLVAHASQVLGVAVTRTDLRHQRGGVPNFKRWRIARAVKRAAASRRRTRPKKNNR